MIKTPVENSLQVGDKFKVRGTLKAELYKVERNEFLQDNRSLFKTIRRLLISDLAHTYELGYQNGRYGGSKVRGQYPDIGGLNTI